MRLIQVAVPTGKRQGVEQTLSDEGIEYTVTDATTTEDGDVLVSFPLPTAAVESTLEALREVGVDESTYTVVLEAETVISARYEELEERHTAAAGSTEEGLTGADRIAREELESRATDLLSTIPTYVALTVVSAVIATAGMLLDSPATVVGSMVIAPLIGPSMAASVGTVINDRGLFKRGVKMQLMGILVAVGSAAVFALMVRYLFLVPPGIDILELSEINERATPNFLVLAIALGAGVAGILSLMTGVSTAIVGVMIAVALIPPAAAVGLGIAFGIPRLALGAGVLVTVNVLSINLASLAALWFEGYRPERWLHVGQARGALLRQVLVLAVTIAVLSAFLGGATYDSYVAATTEEDIRAVVGEEIEQADIDLQLRDLSVTRSGTIPPLETDRVVVTLAIDPDEDPLRLVDRLEARIAELTHDDVVVEVEYVLVERRGGDDETVGEPAQSGSNDGTDADQGGVGSDSYAGVPNVG